MSTVCRLYGSGPYIKFPIDSDSRFCRNDIASSDIFLVNRNGIPTGICNLDMKYIIDIFVHLCCCHSAKQYTYEHFCCLLQKTIDELNLN